MAEVHGFCDERFAPLEALFREYQDTGMDEGASLAVTLGGEPVVDLWGGTRDYARELPWERDTLVRVFSASKPLVITSILLLYDQGQLDLDEPLAAHWPEFARNGKGMITTRQVLVHRSGVPGFGRPISVDELHDWDRMVEILAAAEPWYEPGTRTYYHAHTFGFLLGELIRRISGRSFDEFFGAELADPLGAELPFTLPVGVATERLADLWPPENMPEDEDRDPVMLEIDGAVWFGPEMLDAVVPATGCMTSGRALARVAGMLAMGGELDGRRYLSRATIEEATTEQSYAEDHYIGWVRYGLGFGLDHRDFKAATPTSFHWGGFGGSLFSADMETGMGVGYTPNRLLLGDSPGNQERLLRLIATLGEVSRELA